MIPAIDLFFIAFDSQFAGSLRAGQRGAAVMRLIQSAKLTGHDTYAYLKDVLTRLPGQRASLIHELVPRRWQPQTRLHHLVNMVSPRDYNASTSASRCIVTRAFAGYCCDEAVDDGRIRNLLLRATICAIQGKN
jgi:hypothetical protein